MNNQMFQIGEIAITQGMNDPVDNGIEVEILGLMEWCGGIDQDTGKSLPGAWRYPVRWPTRPVGWITWISYWKLRKKRPPSEEIPEMEGFEVEA